MPGWDIIKDRTGPGLMWRCSSQHHNNYTYCSTVVLYIHYNLQLHINQRVAGNAEFELFKCDPLITIEICR